ncbi:MAG TPA: FkbM family methyltransferase [Chitinophagaceae bacterium]|nr:FkbM family methyltransferase [Chitinophagaceae bacterium]
MIKRIYYELLDMITLRKGLRRSFNGHSIQMPVRFYKYFPADYEAENLLLIDKYIEPGMHVVDVGAHIGLMSVIFAHKTGVKGKVYAFEPTPSSFELLQKTIALNHSNSIIRPENAALGEQSGETSFFISEHRADNSNSLVDNNRQDRLEQRIRVKLYSIDDYVNQEKIEKIDFIKIDAEGAELSVLRGALKTLQRFQPNMILALHPEGIRNFGHNLEDIWDFITGRGYKILFRLKEMAKQDFTSRAGFFDVFITS